MYHEMRWIRIPPSLGSCSLDLFCKTDSFVSNHPLLRIQISGLTHQLFLVRNDDPPIL